MSTTADSEEQRTFPARAFATLGDDLDELTDDELTERFRRIELEQRRLAAEMAAIAHRVDRRRAYRHDGHRAISGWLRAHGNYSGAAACRMKRLSSLLATCPSVGCELFAGRIGVDQAAELARAGSNPRCGSRLGDSIDLLLDHAQRLGFRDFRRCVQRWEMLADLEGAHRDRGHAVEARHAHATAGVDGVDLVAGGGTPLQAAQLKHILDAFASEELKNDLTELRERLGPGAAVSDLGRTDAQRRFDALVAIFHTANNSTLDGTPPSVTVDVICDQYSFESVLAAHDLADEPTDLLSAGPVRARCETSTGVPLLPDDAVLAALGGWVRRVVVDSASVVVDMGRRSRLFAGSSREAARLLATTCEMPGCDVPEHWGQVDHLDEWAERGVTDQRNSAVLCGHHNRHKHRSGFRVRRDHLGKIHVQRPDGTWLTPVGCDPPNDADFITDDELRARARERLFNALRESA